MSTQLRAATNAPSRSFALLPTPLQPTPQLAQALGLDRPLFVKRDDLTGPGLGGNKVRKLDHLLEDALARGADCVVTAGAGQSNHARLTAILAATCGLEAHLVLGGGEPAAWQGNVLLGRLAGASLHFVDSTDWYVLGEALDQVTGELERRGRRPYSIPMGGSTPVGARGYAAGYLELLDQLEALGIEAGWVVHASSTGGTQAGLLAGRRGAGGRGPRIFGIDVAKGGPDLRETVLSLANATLAAMGADGSVGPEDVVTSDFTGTAYGAVTPASAKALGTALRSEGLLLDPVYSAKALAGLSSLARSGHLGNEEPLVFLHTGGQPALFSAEYADVLLMDPALVSEGSD